MTIRNKWPAWIVKLIGLWFILIGLGLFLGFSLNPHPGDGWFILIFLTFMISGVGILCLKNWAKISLNIAVMLLIILLVVRFNPKTGGGDLLTSFSFWVALMPSFFLNISPFKKTIKS